MTTAPVNHLPKVIQESPFSYAVTTQGSGIQSWQDQGGCVTLTMLPYGCGCDIDRATLHNTYYNLTKQQRCACNKGLEYQFTNPLIVVLQEHEIGRGHNFETDKELATYQIAVLDVTPVLCYYRCANNPGDDNSTYGVAAVPLRVKKWTRKIQRAIQRCKDRLQMAGVTDLVNLQQCRPPKS